MAPRRRKLIIDDVVDSAVDALFDRVAEGFDRMRQEPAPVAVPVRPVDSGVRMCAACRKSFRSNDLEMVNPRNSFGLCPKCFGFMWNAAKQLMAGAKAQPQQPIEPPAKPRRPPWEVLGIGHDASIEDVKRAYRKLAAQFHPDTVPPGTPSSEKERVTEQFMEVQRAFDVMMKVRKAPTGG